MSNYQSLGRKSLLTAAIVAVTAAMTSNAIAQEQGLVLEEIIITAQKRESSVQDISATVNVVTGADIEKFQIFEFGAIEEQTAGLTLSSPNARNSTISMRGVGTDPEAGTPPAVDVYWNEINVRPDIIFNQLYDLERMEILRGPQGTLQGRTSPGGAINVLSRRASVDEASGYIQGSVGDDDTINTQAAYGAPLVDGVLGARVALVYDENNSNNVNNITTGLDPDAKAVSTRVSLAWQAMDTLSADLAWQWLDNDINDPKGLWGSDLTGGGRPTLGTSDLKALAKTNDGSKMDYNIVSLRLGWELTDSLELAYVFGYNDSEKKSKTNNDRAFYVTDSPDQLTHQTTDTEITSWANELRLSSQDNEFWDWMTGLYYLDQDSDTTFNAHTTLPGNTPAIGASSFSTNGAIPLDSNEMGIFTFNSFYLTETVTLEAGLRFSRYDRYRKADVFYGSATYGDNGFDPAVIDALIGGSGQFPLTGVTQKHDDDTALTGSLTMRYDWSDETSWYLSYNHGYRPGGSSIVPDPDLALLTPEQRDDILLYDEETSDAVELGFKSRLMDGRATLNGALYYQAFSDYFGFTRGIQILDTPAPGGAPKDITGGIVYNGDATIWGAELEGQVLLTETWSLGSSLSYSKGEWDDGAEAPCNVYAPGEQVGSCAIDGDALGGEPEYSASVNSEFYVPISEMELYLRGLYKYTGERDNTDASAGIGNVMNKFEDHHIVNLYTGIRSADYSWDVTLWVKNVFDSDEVTYQQAADQYDKAATVAANPANINGSYTHPNIQKERSFGVTARYNF